jgi:hypothetical protein
MTDIQILPGDRVPIAGREVPSREYLRFFALLAKAYLQTGGAITDIAALVSRIEALENEDDIPVVLQELENIAPGLIARLPGNTWGARKVESADATRIVVTDGDGQAGNPTIDLAELADSGTGTALVKLTRDDYGRVEGTEAATAADLPYDNTASGLAATNTQDAIDEVSGVASAGGGMVPYFIATGETFTVSEYKQALFVLPIDCEGSLVVDGYLLEV